MVEGRCRSGSRDSLSAVEDLARDLPPGTYTSSGYVLCRSFQGLDPSFPSAGKTAHLSGPEAVFKPGYYPSRPLRPARAPPAAATRPTRLSSNPGTKPSGWYLSSTDPAPGPTATVMRICWYRSIAAGRPSIQAR